MRPLSLRVEIDALRTWLGHWAKEESSKGLAREIAYSMAAAHLERGQDVVLPQLDVRQEVIARLAAIARDCNARFVEVVLTAEAAELAARVAHSPPSGVPHPRDLVTPDELGSQIEHYTSELDRLTRALPSALCIDVSGLTRAEAAARVRSAVDW